MTSQPLRVLLVEDDDTDALLFRHAAADDGTAPLHVRHVGDLAAGITASHQHDVDVVLLDLGLPDSVGLPTFRTFRDRGADLPVVVLTGTADDEVAMAAIEAGAQDFVAKGDLGRMPVVRILRYAVERHRLQANLRRQAASLAASERELAASEARFRNLVELADDVLYRITLDPDMTMDYVSPAIVDSTGVDAGDFYADPGLWSSRVHPGDLARWEDRTRLEAGVSDCVVVRWRLPDDSWAWLEDRRTPVFVDGELMAIQGIIRDVSTRERAEEALRNALHQERLAVEKLRSIDEMKGTFLQAVSHELRTPLTVIRGFAETLQEHGASLDEEQRARILERLTGASARLERLLVDLLDVDRLARGLVPLDCQPAQVRPLVDDVLDAVDPDGHVVTADCDEALVVSVDGAKVERVLENLLRNAVKHTPAGTSIHVAATARAGGLRLVVEDDGPGVPTELVERIFDPFAQGADAQRAASPGTGIGLSLVARFAELHGGEAKVEPRPGGGTRFVVDLPGAAPDHEVSRWAAGRRQAAASPPPVHTVRSESATPVRLRSPQAAHGG